jgi:polyhydroxyalkanoate synthesis regulator phasin
MASDLNTILKKYLANLGKNEEAAVELTRSIKSWVVQNGEIVKERIESQIDETAVRMGFAKSSEIENLNARIAELENRLKGVSGVKKDSTSKHKKPGIKKSAAPKKVSKSSKASAAIKSTKKKVSK